MRKYNSFILVGILFLLFGINANAQQLDFELRFNEETTVYEVYATPDIDNPTYFVGGGSQLSLVLPKDIEDVPLQITSVNGGMWNDNSRIFAPESDHVHDFHGIASNGAKVNFIAGETMLLFTFTLPGGACRSDVRLYENTTDISFQAAGMNGSDFKNYFANVFTPMNNSWMQNENVVNPNCAAAPVVDAASMQVEENTQGTICISIEDNNVGDTFEAQLCESVSSSLNGLSVLSISGNEFCLNYTPSTDYIGLDEVCVEVCDQTGLCNTSMVAITVVPDAIHTSFSASAGDCQNVLNWTIFDPSEFLHFELQKSEDGVNFISLGEFESNNQPNSMDFEFVDNNTISDYYYRLKLVFANQDLEFTEPIFVNSDCEEGGTTFYSDIEAHSDHCQNQINWSINNQNELASFELERSKDNGEFRMLETYEAAILSTLAAFSFTDKDTKGDHYYRLKLIFLDGTISYSENAFVKTDCVFGESDFVIYPNPIDFNISHINIKFVVNTRKTKFILSDPLGRVIRRLSLELEQGVNTMQVDISNIASGTYFITLEGKEVITNAFVKLDERF